MATSILKSSFRTNLVKALLFEIISKTSRYHYVFGRKQKWPTILDPETQEIISDENSAPSVSDTFPYELESRSDTIYSKLVDSNDVSAVVQRYSWTPGYIFDMYDEYSADNPSSTGALSLQTAQFYTVTDEYNVYKCLDNNYGSKSFIKPTGTSREPVVYSDGYMWKYMYTIPLYLRNKFLTSNVMPVVTSLTGQFYSNGSITNYTIQNRGKDYVKITSYGISKIVVIDGGSGYDANDLSIDFPEPPQIATATATVSGGSVSDVTITFGGYGYIDSISPQVVVSAPDTIGGTQAVITVSSTDGSIDSFVIVEPGTGYTTPPTISIDAPPGGVSEGDKRKPTIAGIFVDDITGEVLNIIIADQGAGYITQPAPIVTNTVGVGLTLKTYYEKDTYTSLSLSGDGYITSNPYSLKSITIENPGLYTTKPVGNLITFPSPNINGNTPVVKVEFAQILTGDNAGKYTISNIHIIEEGSGYTSPLLWYGFSGTNRVTSDALTNAPNVEVPAILNLNTSTQKNEAILLPIINNYGEIEAILVEDPGLGYTFSSVVIQSKITRYINNVRTTVDLDSTIRPNFTRAIIQLDFGIGTIDSRQSDVELTAIDGAIYVCKVKSRGVGYDLNTSLTVVGDGEGCVIEPVLGDQGSIVAVRVLNPGRNYRSAVVQVNGAGSNAVIDAIIAPKGGHGKDAIEELYASTLLFTSRIINESINNIVSLESGFRRVSIQKNIKKHNIDEVYQNLTGTSCFLLTVDKNTNNTNTFSLINIQEDQSLFLNDDSNEYLIVEAQEIDDKYYILVLPLNTSLSISPGNSLFLETGESISISSVVPPTINKYSGDMIYLENRTKFYSTDQQAVRLSTSIIF